MFKKIVRAGLHRIADVSLNLGERLEPFYERIGLYEKLAKVQRDILNVPVKAMTLEARLDVIDATRVAYHETIDALFATSEEERRVSKLAAETAWKGAFRTANEAQGIPSTIFGEPEDN